jgi:hypothetical protein
MGISTRSYKTGLMGISTRSYKTGYHLSFVTNSNSLFFSEKFVVFFKTSNDRYALCIYDAIDKDKDKELAAAKCSLVFESFFEKSFQFTAKDGSTSASTNMGKLLLLSKIQILVDTFLENINFSNIKVSTDECFESSFSSIGVKMAEIDPIEKLELLYTINLIYNNYDKACVSEANASVPHAVALAVPHALALVVPHANANANDNDNANADANAVEHVCVQKDIFHIVSFVSFVSPFLPPFVSPCFCSILTVMFIMIFWASFGKINKKYFDIIKSTYRHKFSSKGF